MATAGIVGLRGVPCPYPALTWGFAGRRLVLRLGRCLVLGLGLRLVLGLGRWLDRSAAGEAGLEVPDDRVVGQALVHVGEIRDQIVQEVTCLTAQ